LFKRIQSTGGKDIVDYHYERYWFRGPVHSKGSGGLSIAKSVSEELELELYDGQRLRGSSTAF